MMSDQHQTMQEGLTSPIDNVVDELTLLEEKLSLDGMNILDLGCGAGTKTLAIATAGTNRHVLGLEVDEIQHAKNIASDIPPNVSFQLGGAQNIPAESDSFDVVLLFKSLHHVPTQDLDKALDEIVRILKPGGMVWISEPLFRGDFNEVLRLFHDESAVRRAAFEAILRSVNAGKLELVSETFFLMQRHFQDFADFERQVIGVTHTRHHLTPELLEQVRTLFQEFVGEDGAHFHQPIRVDLLRKPRLSSV